MVRLEMERGDSRPAGAGCRLIGLRRYSLALCLLEALAICVFVYLLLSSGAGHSSGPEQPSYPAGPAGAAYRAFSAPAGQVSLLVGTHNASACNLRRYLLRHAVKCRSKSWFACAPVEQERLEAAKAPPPPPDASWVSASVISTSKLGARLLKRQVRLERVHCKPQLEQAHLDPCRFSTRVVVHPRARLQRIIGWGGALSDSSCQNILALSVNGTKRLLDDYFGWQGLRYNMIRVSIGGSDFSHRFYTNDDSARDDFELREFALREEDLLHKVPLLKLIAEHYSGQWRAADALKVFASMWSPPLWMKTNRHPIKGMLKGGISAQQQPPAHELYFEALAELKLKFLLAYQRETRLNFWGLTVMNEPVSALNPALQFNTLIFPRQDYANYLAKYLGPKIRQNEQLKRIKLMVHDDNRHFLTNFTMPLLADARLANYIDGVATHGYVDEDYQLQDIVYDKLIKRNQSDGHQQAFVLATELSCAHAPFMAKALLGSWHRGMHYALDIVRSLQHSSAGWVDWNMALDTRGGPAWLDSLLDAPVIVDAHQDAYYKSPMFYVLGQFSRYIPPGSQRVQSRIYNDQFDAHFEHVTFALPDAQQLLTVFVNNNPYPIQVMLRVAGEQPLTTTNTYYSYTCEPDSVSTIIYSSEL